MLQTCVKKWLEEVAWRMLLSGKHAHLSSVVSHFCLHLLSFIKSIYSCVSAASTLQHVPLLLLLMEPIHRWTSNMPQNQSHKSLWHGMTPAFDGVFASRQVTFPPSLKIVITGTLTSLHKVSPAPKLSNFKCQLQQSWGRDGKHEFHVESDITLYKDCMCPITLFALSSSHTTA